MSSINIYYINLLKSTERNIRMQEQLKHMDTLFVSKRVEGIDGDVDDLEHHILINQEYYKSSNLHDNASIPKEFKKRQIACLASHLYAIKQAYDNNLNEVIITEDDINLKILNFTYKSLVSLQEQNPDIDILQLYSSADSIKPEYINSIKQDNLCLIPKQYEYWGCCAYLINRNGMEKVLKYFNKELNKFDFLDSPLTEMLVSDNIIYKSCNTKTTSIPYINILNPENVKSIINLIHSTTDLTKKINSHINLKNRQFSLMNPQNTDHKLVKYKSDVHLQRNVKHYQWIENNTNIFIKFLQSKEIIEYKIKK